MDDEKVRRNLVVFCGFVLVANFLDVSLAMLVTSFFRLDVTPLDPLRVLALSLAILIYLAVRYKFSEDGQKFSADLTEEWNRICLERTKRWCRWAVMLYTKRGIEIPGIFAGNLNDILRVTSATAYQANGDRQPTLKDVTFSMSSTGAHIWKYQGFATFRWSLTVSGAEVPTDGLVSIEYSRSTLLALKCVTYLQMWFYSKGSINALIPVLLGMLTAIVLTMKVITLTMA
jgi:hypothetical protein